MMSNYGKALHKDDEGRSGEIRGEGRIQTTCVIHQREPQGIGNSLR